MSQWIILSSIALIHIAAMASPGPNFIVVTQTSISNSRRAGILTAIGITIGALVWSSSALLGVSFLFNKFSWLYQGMRLLGGVYLVYLAIKMWIRNPQLFNSVLTVNKQAHSSWAFFLVGLMTNLTNPQSIVFFGSIFTALLPPESSIWIKVASVAIIVMNVLWWHCLLALVFSTRKAQKIYQRAKRLIDRVAASILAILGLHLILSSR